jgi:Spy/CpxP family protein refolding chaperone
MKRQVIWGLAGVLALASYALAQQASPPAQEGARPQRQRRGPGGPGGPGGQRGMFGLANLPDSLKLTDEQKAKVTEIQRNVFREMRGQGGPPNREDFQKMRDLRRQLQEAAQAGDDVKVQQLQTELDGLSFSQNRKQMQEAMDKQIAEILTSQQRRQFEQWKRLRDSGLPPQLISNPQALKDAALKIQSLSDMQKNSIEAAYDRYDRGSAHADEATKATLADQFASEVLLTLKPAQKVLLTSAAMRGPRGGPLGGRGGGRMGGRAGAQGGGNAGPAGGAEGATGGANAPQGTPPPAPPQ